MDALQAVLDNKYFIATLAVLTACYGGFAAPKLNPAALSIVASDWFKLIIIFLVAYLPKKNFQLALCIAVAFVLTSHVLVQYKIFEGFQNGGFEEDN